MRARAPLRTRASDAFNRVHAEVVATATEVALFLTRVITRWHILECDGEGDGFEIFKLDSVSERLIACIELAAGQVLWGDQNLDFPASRWPDCDPRVEIAARRTRRGFRHRFIDLFVQPAVVML